MKALSLRQRLNKVDRIHDPLKRKLFALSILTEALKPHRLRPILIGGSALEFYTLGGYMTGDMDLALPHSPVVDAIFKNLGFEKDGRYWSHDKHDLLIEAPTAHLAGEEAPLLKVEVEGLCCYLIGLEDLLLDRLNGFAHWKWEDDGRWVRRLLELHSEKINLRYLKKKAKEQLTLKALLSLLKKKEPSRD